MEVLLLLLGGTFLIALPVIAIVAFVRVNGLREDIKHLKKHIEFIKRRLSEMPEPTAPDPPEPIPEEEPEPEPEIAPAMAADHIPEQITAPEPPPVPSPEMLKITEEGGLEESLASRWLVWLGGIALALGGGFLVKYSIDEGYFGPGVRIAFGVIAALVMLITGEWLRRRDEGQDLPLDLPNYVPSALAAAGIFTAFATVWSAYALYDMLPSLVAFILLAVIAFAGMAFSILFGEFLAALGLIGALTVPALVSTDNPNIWTLFTYLLVVSMGAASLVRYRDWWRIGVAVLIGALVWPILWTIGGWHWGDSLPISLFTIAISGIFLFWLYPGSDARTEKSVLPDKWRDYADFPQHVKLALASVPGTAFILLIVTRLDHYSILNLILAAIFASMTGWAAWRFAALRQLYAWGAAFILIILGLWHLPNIMTAEFLRQIDDELTRMPIVPPGFSRFVMASIGFGLLFGVSGFLAARRSRAPGFWAATSSILILILLVLAYGRIADFTPALEWGLVGMLLGLIFLGAASMTSRTLPRDATPADKAGLAAYAVATIAAIALAFTMTLEDAWLTVALSLMLPATGWVWQKLQVPGLRTTAQIIAVIVIVRLVLNPYILDYGSAGHLSGTLWVLYGYGIPAFAFYLARSLFGKTDGSQLNSLLEAGMLVFAVWFVSLEIRILASQSGTLTGSYGLFEQGLQTLSWMAFAWILLILEGRERKDIYRWGRIGLTIFASGNLVFFEGFGSFPLFDHSVNVGTLPIFNTLLIAYALPGLACIALYKAAKNIGDLRYAQMYGAAMLILTFVWLNLEVRHWFQGQVIALTAANGIDDAESYAYSAIWLLYAGLLLATAFWRNIAVLRYASLAILLLAVAKVFLIDMSTLEGLWRAISFLGLGGALVGVGFLYQRFVFARPKEVN